MQLHPFVLVKHEFTASCTLFPTHHFIKCIFPIQSFLHELQFVKTPSLTSQNFEYLATSNSLLFCAGAGVGGSGCLGAKILSFRARYGNCGGLGVALGSSNVLITTGSFKILTLFGCNRTLGRGLILCCSLFFGISLLTGRPLGLMRSCLRARASSMSH